MAKDFKSLLSTPLDSVERPKHAPAGTYHGHITKYALDEKAPFGKTDKEPIIRFNILLTGPTEGIDPELLEGVDLAKISARLTRDMFLGKDDMYRVKDLIESYGHDTTGRQLDAFLDDLVGEPALIEITATSKDGRDFFNNIRSMRGAGSE